MPESVLSSLWLSLSLSRSKLLSLCVRYLPPLATFIRLSHALGHYCQGGLVRLGSAVADFKGQYGSHNNSAGQRWLKL